VAVSSLLNPSSIVKERRATVSAAQNFITGGSPLGSGVVASAANKIVGFQRGAGVVTPKPPDLNSIIQTLSSNILNNVENRVQSINQNVTQIVDTRIGKLEKDYGERLNRIDAARPNSILQNFLNLYKEAIGYIQFLGNRKNIKTLGDNLKALQNVFTETFNIAKIIRQTIVKIVKQLSNLPTANAGGGGLNLDIDIPGAGLRKGPMSLLSKVARGGKAGLMLGGAALAGGLGSKVVSGMLDIGGDVQAAPMAEGTIPGVLLDRFNSILDRFSKAIDSLSNVKKTQPTGGGTSPSSKQPEKSKPAGTKSGATPTTPATSSAPGDEKLAAFVASMEASSPENAADAMQVMLNRSASGKYGKGLSGVLSGYDQFSPISAAIFGKSADPAAAAKYGPIAAKLPGKTPQEKFQALQQIANEPDGLNKLQNLFGGGSAGVAAKILNDPKYLEMSRQNVKGALNFYGGRQQQSGDLQFRPGGNYFYNFSGPIGKLGSQPTGVTAATTQIKPSTVAASQTQVATQQQIAQTVSQPPIQQAPQVNIAPLNVSSPQTQSTKVGDTIAPPPVMSKGGVTVPFLTSSNHDNFLTLYSKMVYNIVDG
jgi:hypothetical protein